MWSRVSPEKLFACSLYALSLAIFVSVSLIPLFQFFILLSFFSFMFTKKVKINIPYSVWALGGFVAAELISATWNFSELREASHSFGIIKYPIVGILMGFLFQNLPSSIFLNTHVKRAAYLFFGTIILAFLYGCLKVYAGFDLASMKYGDYGDRLSGFTEIMRYGYGSGMVLLVLVFTSLNSKVFALPAKKYLRLTILVCFLGMLLSFTRGSLLGFLIAFPVGVYFYKKTYGYFLSGLSTLIILALVLIALSGGNKESRFFMSADNQSNTIRISQYQAAWKAFVERPMLGFGPQQFKYHVEEIKERYDISHKEFVMEHSHNVFLEALANTGVVGFLFFVMWLLAWLRESYKLNRVGKQVFLPIVLFIVVAGQVEMLWAAQTSTLIYFLYSLSFHPMFRASERQV